MENKKKRRGMLALLLGLALTVCGGALLTQARHIDAAMRAAGALEEMVKTIESGMPLDFASVDATSALRALGEITGEDAEEGIVDAVFANFCVGK